MIIGVIKEIKNNENRVAMTPSGAATLTAQGHEVNIQSGAGAGSGFSDQDYQKVGCQIVSQAAAWDSELILKVKEPLPAEYCYLKQQTVFTYFHLAGVAPSLTEALLTSGTTALAYETVEDSSGSLSLLAPMSAIAGNMAVTVGSYYLARFNQGKGVQLGVVMGEQHGKVAIIGDGVVARHAARVAVSMGAETVVFSRHLERETALKKEISECLRVVASQPENIASELRDTDLLVGAVLLRGGRAPHAVTKEMVASMEPGSVLVDVSIDQGGCIETSKPTSHSEPVYQDQGVTHYCVTNMPGAYPRTATIALTNTTLPYVQKFAEEGFTALHNDRGFAQGVNTYRGYITYLPAAEGLGMSSRYRGFEELIQEV